MKRYDKFYDSEEWMRVRYQALKQASGRCQCCGEQPIIGNPLHVDHIKPRSRFPELALTITNLQVLCKKCNLGKGAWDATDWRPEQKSELSGGAPWVPANATRVIPLREAMVLRAVLNHPWILAERAEELATFPFTDEQTKLVCGALLDLCAATADLRPARASLRAAITARGLDEALNEIDDAIRHWPRSPIKTSTAPADVHQWWIFVIHSGPETRRLVGELRQAEIALGNHTNNANFERLRRVQTQLHDMDERLTGKAA